MALRFGPAGICNTATERSSLGGVMRVAELGLDAMELEFVHGCRMSKEKALEVGKTAKEKNVSLSCHASYYLNLLSPEKPKLENTRRELRTTALILSAAGGGRLVFHPGFFLKKTPEQAFTEMKNEVSDLMNYCSDNAPGVVIAPEVTGKHSAWGSTQETLRLVSELDSSLEALNPCIDISHVQARRENAFATQEQVNSLFAEIERVLGKKALKTIHFHAQDVEFTEKGERNHLPIGKGTINWNAFVHALHEFKVEGTIISESPLMEEDVMKLKKMYEDEK